MTHPALSPLDQAIAALTNKVEVMDCATGVWTKGSAVPLLDRSIAQDLLRIESSLSGKGTTLLFKLAASIDAAIVSIEEARRLLGGGDGGNVE